ncbi:DUF305 domain-containing protein [Streptomyces sp. GSL17-111]|uniref:DUF305 domain-containing protein n=1 Tax=Streptomyces sp. GSL17-111 TaxID=3121596 RepID=UPI0030F3DB29
MTARTSARRVAARRTAGGVAALVAALALTACGSDGDGTTTNDRSPGTEQEAEQHNAADVAFAQEMIPHHRQAIEMAELAPERAGSPEVRALAAEIEEAQAPEIETMSGWLRGWGEPVPGASGGMDHGPHDGDGDGGDGDGDGDGDRGDMDGDHGDGHDGGSMPGMMTGEQMKELAEAEGAAFDTLFLRMMIEHHEGAVEMAEDVRAEGSHGPTRTLADDVIKVQSEEIATMRELLDADGG